MTKWLVDGEEEKGFKNWLKKDVWWPIKHKLEDIWIFPRLCWEFLVRLVQYLPIIWKDRDFDHAYIFIMLQYKLKRTREHIVDHQFISKADEVGAEIKVAEDMIEDHFHKDWTEKEQAAHEAKYGELVQDFITVTDKPELTEKWGKLYECNSYRTLAREAGLGEQEREEQMAIYDLHRKREQENLDKLFKYIRDHIEGWWD